MKNKKTLIIVFIIVALLIVAGVIGFLYLKTDLFKSNQELFYKYLFNEEIAKALNTETIENGKTKLEQKNYTTNGEITVKAESDDSDIALAGSILQNLKINYETKNNVTTNQAYGKAALNFGNKEIINFEYLKDNDTYAITSKEILNKYLAVENNNLKELAQKLGVEDVSSFPDKIDLSNYENLLNIDNSAIDTIKTYYKNVLNNQLTKDKFTVQKNIATTIGNESVTANVYTVSLTDKETFDITVNLLQAIKNDDFTINLLIEKLNLLGIKDITADQIKQEVQKMLDDLDPETTEFTNTEMFTVSVYVSDGKTVKIDVALKDSGIIITEGIDIMYNANTINFYAKSEEDGTVTDEITTSIKSTIENNNSVLSLNMKILSESQETNIQLQYNTNSIDSNNMTNTLELTFGTDKDKFTISAKENVNIVDNVEIEKITTQNAAKINDMSAENIMKLATQISTKVQSVFEEKVQEIIMQIYTSQKSN